MVMLIMQSLKERNQVYYASPRGEIEEELRRRQLSYIPMNRLSVTEIHRIQKSFQPELFHATDYRVSILCALAGVKFVSHIHNNAPWLRRITLYSIAYLFAALGAERIIAVSNAIQKEYIFAGLVKNKIIVLPNVADGEAVKEKAEMEKDKAACDILFSGRLVLSKRPLFFVEIAAELKKRRGKIKAVMLGQGDLREDIRKAIKEYQLEDSVELPGYLDNPFPVVAASKVLVMPSAWEGFGLAAIEAMTLGKPVVCSPVGGLTDIVDDTCGKLCDGKEEFLKEISRLLEDKDYYRRKSLGAVERAKQYADIQGYAKSVEDIWREAQER